MEGRAVRPVPRPLRQSELYVNTSNLLWPWRVDWVLSVPPEVICVLCVPPAAVDVSGCHTATFQWHLVSSFYDYLPWSRCGVAVANQPWNGWG